MEGGRGGREGREGKREGGEGGGWGGREGGREGEKGRIAWRLLHKLNGEIPKQRVRRQPLKTGDACVRDSRKKAK